MERIRFENTKAKLNRNTTMRANWAMEIGVQLTVVAPKITMAAIQMPRTRAKNRLAHFRSRASLDPVAGMVSASPHDATGLRLIGRSWKDLGEPQGLQNPPGRGDERSATASARTWRTST